ncbi:hypothetical protein AALO_G00237500 [Alosa alosa]|uniref:Uncharacterized protein n=1 Tax=Alosa alosa TaxID=278164 RepID=A0AAV6FYX8_9TELE|nr:HAUS augmin-like complex subunit 2 [Alosa alosa]KAG5266896.1 hypothetical protein AALO_G00237500 [Alosa alosa]
MSAGDTSTVSAEGQLLESYITSGFLTQEEIDGVRKQDVFSSNLYNVVKLNEIQRESDERAFQLELLKLDKEFADVSHNHYLNPRIDDLQKFNSHLQRLLQEHISLKKRLMNPRADQSLPIHADMHKDVVELISMVTDFIENLDLKIKTVQSIPNTQEDINKLNMGMAQLLTLVKEVESLHQQVLQWREKHQGTSTEKQGPEDGWTR